MALVTGTWASAADVASLPAGHTPTDAQLNLAQMLIENLVRRVYRATDATGRDYVWLQRAVALQADYVIDNPDLFNQAEISSTSQDGWSVTFRDGIPPRAIAPAAMAALNNLRGAANVTVRFNSAFQGSGRRGRIGWRPLGGRRGMY